MRKIVILVIAIILFVNPVKAKTIEKSTNGQTISVTQNKYGTKVRWNGKVIQWYDFNGNVKFISERKLTAKKLITRKNKILYIEIIKGKVINTNGDGKTETGNYISYKRLGKKVRKGSVVVTYCVYSPYTHWIDDVDERYDVVIKR